MKAITIAAVLVAALLWTSLSHAQCSLGDQAVTDPATKADLRVFWNDLVTAVRQDNKKDITNIVAYPLLVSSSRKFRVHSAQEFIGKYDQIFTKGLRGFLLKQDPDCIARVGAQGFSVGTGEI
jgi:hypothetical protein